MIVEFFRKVKGNYFCLSTKDENKRWKDYYFSREELRKIPAFIEKHSDKDIYWCPHGFKKAGSRKKDNAMLDSWAWADLDEANPEKIPIRPTVAIESSPGRFVGLWKLDGTITEELNKAITQFVGADPSGYDLGQVLRVPGTRNYKYARMPKVKVLWEDGISYRIEKLTTKVKHLMGKRSAPKRELEAQPLIDHYFKKLSPDVRQSIIRPRGVDEADRSTVLFKLVNSMMDAGMSDEEIAVVLGPTAWNKFNGKADSRNKFMADIKRTRDKRDKEEDGEVVRGPREALYDPLSVPGMDDGLVGVEKKTAEWYWRGRLPRVGLVFLEADAGIGKSYFSYLACSYLCRGKPFPHGGENDIAEPVNVLYFDNENDVQETMVGRMENSGLTDKYKHRFIPAPRTVDRPQGWDLLDEEGFDLINRGIVKHNAKVVVFDVLNNYASNRYNENDANAVARLGAALETLVMRHNILVIGIRHLNKDSEKGTQNRGAGSYKLKSIPRVVIGMGYHPEEPSIRRVAVIKHNNTSSVKAIQMVMKRRGEEVYPRWGDLEDEHCKENIYSTPEPKEAGNVGAVKKFLEAELKMGAKTIDKIRTMCKKRGFQDSDLDDAVEELQLMVTGTRTKYWQLPDTD